MKSRIPRLAAAVALLALALPAAAQAAPPSYYPSGPQLDVARASVTDAAWTVRYSGDYAKGDKGAKGDRRARTARTTVRCGTKVHGSGARMVCTFNRRSGRNSLVQLRDRRGALSTARGNGKRTMVFVSNRKPRGTVYAFVIRGLRTS